jgi:hypothetical protein
MKKINFTDTPHIVSFSATKRAWETTEDFKKSVEEVDKHRRRECVLYDEITGTGGDITMRFAYRFSSSYAAEQFYNQVSMRKVGWKVFDMKLEEE